MPITIYKAGATVTVTDQAGGTGATGSTGSTGSTGATGSTGSTGSSGSTGTTAPPPSDLSWFTSKQSGSITNVGAATLASVDASSGRILAASGQIYVPRLGRAGALRVRGGGHNDWNGNEELGADLFLAATGGANPCTVLKPRYTNLFVGPNGYNAETSSGLLWANAAGTATVPGEYSAGHTYGQVVDLPPSLYPADPLGAAIYTGIPSLTPGGNQHGLSCFAFEYSTNSYVPFAGPMPAQQPEYSSSFVDVGRRRIVIPAWGKLLGVNVDTKAYTTINGNLPTSLSYMVWWHDLAHDLYVGVRPPPAAGYPAEVRIVDPATGALTSPGLNTTWPWPAGVSSFGGGYGSDMLGGVVYYHGQGEQSIRLIKPPTSGNPRTSAWSIQVINFTGDAPPKDTMVGAGAHCKRFMPMENAGGALWLGSTLAPVQFWKY